MVLGDAMRYVTSKVDETVVTPVAARLSNSIVNPYTLSYLLWERIKNLTPQRARDLTRLISIAVSHTFTVLQAEKGKALTSTTRRLQDELVAATVSKEGRDVILNSVATASKVAQALNTPETKIATQQLFETLQSWIDFLASSDGHKVIATTGECLSQLCEVAASPETAICLAELATNICHSVEVEALRREIDKRKAGVGENLDTMAASASVKEEEQENGNGNGNGTLPPPPHSPTSSTAETESTLSEFSLPHAPRHTPSTSTSLPPMESRLHEKSARRSARIEKDVLLKMGVDPSMLSEIQRVLDALQEQEEAEAAAAAQTILEEEEEDLLSDHGEEDGFAISNAFGTLQSELPDDLDNGQEENKEEKDVIVPEWHPESVHNALRRRIVAGQAQATSRHTFEDQSREMAAVLTQRRMTHRKLPPADLAACRVIALGITYMMLFLLLFVVIQFIRKILL